MMKSFFNPITMLPLILNLLIIMILMMPSKINNLHPMILMIILINLTFLITLKMNYNFKSWISFMLFLTMIGGLLIIFMYITSLTNNKLFNFNFKQIVTNYIKFIPMIMILLLLNYLEFNYFNLNLNFPNNFNNFNEFNLNMLYKFFFHKSTIFIMIYLYYTLTIIVNICMNYNKPLRQTSYYE